MYATAQDVDDRYGNDALAILTDPGKTGTPNQTQVTCALKDASEEIDAYVGQRYPLPLACMPRVPRVLVRIAADIAVYRLSEGDSEVTKEVRRRYDDALRQLALIAKGDLSLGLDEPSPVARGILEDSAPRRFDRRSMRGAFV